MAAISSGVPNLPNGWRATNAFLAASASPCAAIRSSSDGVWIVPGQIALQRMPLVTKSAATDLVSPITAALLVP